MAEHSFPMDHIARAEFAGPERRTWRRPFHLVRGEALGTLVIQLRAVALEAQRVITIRTHLALESKPRLAVTAPLTRLTTAFGFMRGGTGHSSPP